MTAHAVRLIALALAVGCGGDDHVDRADATPGPVVGPGGDQGQFGLLEIQWGEDGLRTGRASGSILDPRPRYHEFLWEEGACRLWQWRVGTCVDCADGICDAERRCVPFTDPLSAGTVEFKVAGQERAVLSFEAVGYPPETLPEEIFAEGDRVEASADGGDDVASFTLAATAVDSIAIDLERDPAGKEQDKLELVGEEDLVLRWSPPVPGTRVRLEIPSNNRGHGLPVDTLIECEAEDIGEIAVPNDMMQIFPERPYGVICAGSDCPPATLTRFRSDRVEIEGRWIELVVGAQRQFVPVKSR